VQLDHPNRIQGGRSLRVAAPGTPPLVSIVTVVYNAKEELRRLLQDVFTLPRGDFELIIIDGGSNDGTGALLREWDDRIDVWLSEPDRGIYDAMNKAQTYATGEFLLHLNAGDRLLQIPRQELELALEENYDAISFRVSIDDVRDFAPRTGFMLHLKNTLHHQGTFYRRTSMLKYDLSFATLADFDLNQRMGNQGARIKLSDTVVSLHESGGAGDNLKNYDEHIRIVRKNHGLPTVALSLAVNEAKGIAI
jgi:glycosyltransferase involved in cell wall biosynthesis